MKSKIIAAVLVAVAVIAGLLYFVTPKNTQVAVPEIVSDNTPVQLKATIQVSASDDSVKEYPVVFATGTSLKEVMVSLQAQEKGFSFTTETASFGEYLTGINGQSADAKNSEFWNIKINGNDSMVGISEYKLQANDLVLFKITKF